MASHCCAPSSPLPLRAICSAIFISATICPGETGQVLGKHQAQDYLSEDFFPGFHVLENADGTGNSFNVYPQGQKIGEGLLPAQLDLSSAGSFEGAREELARLLQIPAREPMQLPWAMFTLQGKKIKDIESLQGVTTAFVIELGQWMWPPVRVGFEHVVADVRADGGSVTLRTLSMRPAVFEVRDFMTRDETEEVMRIGSSQGLESSKGVMQSNDLKSGKAHDSFRTSKQAWLLNSLSPLIAELDQRTSRLTRVPARHNEPVQLLRYDEGKYYHGHMDWTELELYPDQEEVWVDSQFGHQDRLATVFWYLNDVAEGGETIFPKHGQPICYPKSRGGKGVRSCPGAQDPDMRSCEKGLKVQPRRGSVILWYNFLSSGRGDRNALHAGCPVGKNLTKWSGNKWVRIKPLRSTGRWVDDHPALKRHGWTGGKAAKPDDNACSISFLSAEEDVTLVWRSNGKSTDLLQAQAGQRVSQRSYAGHQFQLRSTASGKLSNIVACTPPSSSFLLDSHFQLVPSGDRKEL